MDTTQLKCNLEYTNATILGVVHVWAMVSFQNCLKSYLQCIERLLTVSKEKVNRIK